jgi:hypothetical protein
MFVIGEVRLGRSAAGTILDGEPDPTTPEAAVPGLNADEIQRMAVAFGLVAGLALPFAVVGWWHRKSTRWRVWRSSWSATGVFVVALGYVMLPALAAAFVEASGGLGPWLPSDAPGGPERLFRLAAFASFLAAPILAYGLSVWVRLVEPPASSASAANEWLARIGVGALAWFVFTPIVFAVHFVTRWAFEQLGGQADEHPLTKTDISRDTGLTLLFVASVCFATPLLEELAFRRALVPWLLTRPARDLPPRVREWSVMGIAFAAAVMIGELRVGPAVFVAVLAAGLWLMFAARRTWHRFPVRTVSAVYVTAALFAAVHSKVWPSPVPLFVLGLGLGWLVVRTRSVVPAVVCHGLFNAVSTVYLLRGGPGTPAP